MFAEIRFVAGWMIVYALLTMGCSVPNSSTLTHSETSVPTPIVGRVAFESDRTAQATFDDIANGASVNLIEESTGNTVAGSTTDASGSFILNFSTKNFLSGYVVPRDVLYILEARRGMALEGENHRAGADTARVRTIVRWDGVKWLSLTNAEKQDVVVSPATTALSLVASQKKAAGYFVDFNSLLGRIWGNYFDDADTGLSYYGDFAPALKMVETAISQDLDPFRDIAFDSRLGTFSLIKNEPLYLSIYPSMPAPGEVLTIRGSGFHMDDRADTFWFGNVPAATWSLSSDRTVLTLPVPRSSYSAPLVLKQAGGAVQTICGFLPIKGTVGTLAGNGVPNLVDGSRLSAQFNHPQGVARDAKGNVFVADAGNHCIRRMDPTGAVSTLAGSGERGFLEGASGTSQFDTPADVAIDGAGTLYVADSGNHRIRMISPTGEVSTLAGSDQVGAVDGVGLNASFSEPDGLVLDGLGNLFVADAGSHTIRRIELSSRTVTTIAGSGSPGARDGLGASAQFNRPCGLAADGNGYLYVADTGNHLIRRVQVSDGAVITFAGSGGSGSQDGVGTTASFTSPTGISIDPSGVLFIADSGAHSIRKISLSGAVTTLTGQNEPAYADGKLAGAAFNEPFDLVVDEVGVLEVSDAANHRMRVVVP